MRSRVLASIVVLASLAPGRLLAAGDSKLDTSSSMASEGSHIKPAAERQLG